MIEIKRLHKVKFEELYDTFSQAYAEFNNPPVTRESLSAMLDYKGFSAKHSFGAYDNGKLVSFLLNGIGEYLELPTVYNAGAGTLKEYRGQNLASRIFEEAVPFLKKKGFKQYLLEVRQDNTSAFNLFKKLGFEVSRDFNVYITDTKNINIEIEPTPENYFLREIELLEKEVISSFWDFTPSWQNSIDAINRRCNDFKALGIYHNHNLIGYGIVKTDSGDIIQLAVDKGHRRKGLGTILINELVKQNNYHLIKLINTEKGYIPMENFLEKHLNISLSNCQYEMAKAII